MIETATSVQFIQLSGLSNAQVALFWDHKLRSDYPEHTNTGPISSQSEQFSELPRKRPQFPILKVGAFPPARLQMMSKDNHQMVQMQNDRLVFNWRRLDKGTYPRWKMTREKFRDALSKFREFLKEENIGELKPKQWEVTYVNHFLAGEDWKSPDDWEALVPGLIGTGIKLPQLEKESLGTRIQLEIKPRKGRLHVELNHGFRSTEDEETEILTLQLVARGPVESEDETELMNGLDLGRSVIVRAFAELTGAEAHKRWGREK
ncbi:MAG: TIGR04255 family protein [Planctomycetes bacterium]|nr:TIGR04255 family protein [Planctomycetota bacterium]